MKHKGFTLIELMVVVAVIGIVAAIFLPMFAGSSSSVTYTWRGTVVTSCVNGYVVMQGNSGTPVQVFGDDGKPKRC